jgi:hypothetical protein
VEAAPSRIEVEVRAVPTLSAGETALVAYLLHGAYIPGPMWDAAKTLGKKLENWR